MRKRRIICLALTVLMLVCLLPIGVLADGATSGECGDNITWTLDSNGTLKLIGEGAMYDYDLDGSDGLPQVPWDHTAVKTVIIGEGITSVGRCSFLDCSNMTKVTLPSTLSKIGELGFAYCFKIASLSIPNGVTEIGAGAFICTSLRSINIPGSVKTIGDSAFVECNMVKDVVVGEGVETIGTRAFDALYNVETIYLPKTLKSIDSTSFSNCNNLSVIYFGGTEDEWYNLVGEQSTVYDDIMVFIECTMFDDVSDPAAYYWSPVMWAYAYGITNGMSATTFEPGGSCTRGQFVTFLWRLLGEEAPQEGYTGQFVDVPAGDYYSDAVAWAASYGIVNGIDKTHFNPSGKITRAQAVTMLWRIMGEPDSTSVSGFVDVKAGLFYETAVAWAAKNGIVNGMSPTTFEPNTTCNRGMTVTYLYRFVNYLASSQEG